MKRATLYESEELATVDRLQRELEQLRSEHGQMRTVVRLDDGSEWTVRLKVERAPNRPAVVVLHGKRTTVED